MPSVLFISLMSGSAWGGSEELWYKAALYAAGKTWKVGCVIYHWPAKESKMQVLKNRGGTIYYLPNKGRSKRNLVERIQNKISKARTRQVLRSLPVDEYDIVVVSQGAFEITTTTWRNFYSRLRKYIVLYHNYKEHEILKGEKKLAVQNWVQQASLNLFASRRIIEVLQNNSGIKVSHAEILLNPISFSTPAALQPYRSLQNGNYCFVVLAALEVWRKAQDNLINALSSEKWKQRNWVLYLYGDGKDKLKLHELIRKNGMEEKIFLKGNTHDVQSVLQNAHLLLQITHIDAMPLSVVEAMAMARPVVVSKIGDMPYWITENENGWISENASIEQIDFILEKTWQHKNNWRLMGENAYKTFKEKFPLSAEELLLEKIKSLLRN
jgi:glycosyltransferase involved in cell wall biosynthesis